VAVSPTCFICFFDVLLRRLNVSRRNEEDVERIDYIMRSACPVVN
jgi:hypothetical protein